MLEETHETEALVEVIDVTKYYGDFLAVDGLSFEAYRGEVLGLLGSNGSGKTTTMRILTGFLPPTSGTARVCGFDTATQSLQARESVGYLPESVPLYTDMSVVDYLGFMGDLRGMPGRRVKARTDEVLGQCRLENYARTMIGKLSKGYRQRVGIAQAIIHDPPVIVLDEPTNSIDPLQVVETRQLIRELGETHAVILSTHVLSEASALCNRVAIVHEGTLIAAESVANLSNLLEAAEVVEIDVTGPERAATGALLDVAGVERISTKRGGETVTLVAHVRGGAETRAEIVRVLTGQGWGVSRLTTSSLELEDVFIKLTREAS